MITLRVYDYYAYTYDFGINCPSMAVTALGITATLFQFPNCTLRHAIIYTYNVVHFFLLVVWCDSSMHGCVQL